MKNFISSILIASILSSTLVAHADPVISPVSKGQSAPFSGVLLSPEAVAQTIAEKDAATQALQSVVQRQIDLDASKLKYQIDYLTTTCVADKSVLSAQVEDNKKQIIILNDQLKKTTGGPSATTWIGLGFAGGVVATVLTVFIVGRVK